MAVFVYLLKALLLAVWIPQAAPLLATCSAEESSVTGTGTGLVQVSATSHRQQVIVNEQTTAPRPTFAVFTRLIKAELPYVDSFVRHYRRLGVDHFYMLSNREKDLQVVEAYLRRHHSKAGFTFFYRNGGADNILRSPSLLPAVREDYVIAIDTDEYWLLPPGIRSFLELTSTLPAEIYYTNWQIVPNDNVMGQASSPLMTYNGCRGKYMAKRSVLRTLHGLHVVKALPGRKYVERRDVGRLVHFWGRNFIDIVLKSVSQVFVDCTGTGGVDPEGRPAFHSCGSAAVGGRGLTRLTGRMKTLALMTLHPRTDQITPDHELLRIDADEEGTVLQGLLNMSLSASMRLVGSLHASYERYKTCVAERVKSFPEVFDLCEHGVNGPGLWLENVTCPDALLESPRTDPAL
mmetsp:Transcript_44687/g.140049  ORF Transcript_44687/g.140049 Transcript_44687/m.140049 type:complete len:405 (-) Transcript_44687:303-1517(-)